MRTLPLALAAAAVLLAGCGRAHHAVQQAPSPTSAATYDGSTLAACRAAVAATTGDTADASKQAQAARSSAALSNVPALREVAEKNTDPSDLDRARDDARALAAAYTIYTWCTQHHVAQ
jgi:hypothetical protein